MCVRAVAMFMVLHKVAILGAEDAWRDASYDPGATPNRTVHDESRGAVQSIFHDMRSDVALIRSAYPGVASVALGVEVGAVRRRSTDADIAHLATPPYGPEVREGRRLADLCLRLPLSGSLSLELEEQGGRCGDGGRERWTWSDMATRLLLSLWDSRYGAVTLVAGARQPLGDVQDWCTAHGSWTLLLGLRSTVGWGQLVMGAEAEAGCCPWAVNQVEDPALGGTGMDTVYGEGHGGAYGTYRLARWLRLGAAQRFAYCHWTGRGDTQDALGSFTVRQLPSLVLLEVDADAGCRLLGYGGADWLGRRDGGGAGGAIAAGACLVITW